MAVLNPQYSTDGDYSVPFQVKSIREVKTTSYTEPEEE